MRRISCLQPYTNKHGCKFWRGYTNQYHYPLMRISLPGRINSTQVPVHRFVCYLCNLKFLPDDHAEMDASHICHNTSCINWEHLIFESRSQNVKRNACKDKGFCLYRHGGPPCLSRATELMPENYIIIIMNSE